MIRGPAMTGLVASRRIRLVFTAGITLLAGLPAGSRMVLAAKARGVA